MALKPRAFEINNRKVSSVSPQSRAQWRSSYIEWQWNPKRLRANNDYTNGYNYCRRIKVFEVLRLNKYYMFVVT